MAADPAISDTLPGHVVLPRSAPLAPGAVLEGRFRLDEVLGGGGVGIVYRAHQLALGRDVAVKVLRTGMSELPELAKRFEREARTLSRLAHPNIVRVDDFGLHGRVPYLVMELLAGRTLDEELRAGPLAIERAVAIARQILSALAHAHAHGVIHRDMKSTNVMLLDSSGDPDVVKVFDFGLARITKAGRDGEEITRHGTINGTPEYISPEQVWGGIADERSDLYSVGVVLFEMLAGRLPFGGDPTKLLAHHLSTRAPRLREVAAGREIPEPLEALVARALEKDRDLRPGSALEMLAELDGVCRELDSPDSSPRMPVAGEPPSMPSADPPGNARSFERRLAADVRAVLLACLAGLVLVGGAVALLGRPVTARAPSVSAAPARTPAHVVLPRGAPSAVQRADAKVGKSPSEPVAPILAPDPVPAPGASRPARARGRRAFRLPTNPYY